MYYSFHRIVPDSLREKDTMIYQEEISYRILSEDEGKYYIVSP